MAYLVNPRGLMSSTSRTSRTSVVLRRSEPGRYTTQHAGHTWHVFRAQTEYGDEQYVIDRDDEPSYAQVGTLDAARATIAAAQPAIAYLTAAERRCLGNVIALGGTWSTGNGADCRGAVRRNTVLRLSERGLVELGARKTRSQVAADRGEPAPERHRDDTFETFYATAAGCAAYGPEVARVS